MGKKELRFSNIGIESIGFYAPRARLDMERLAVNRGQPVEKYHYGLMVREFAVPDYGEDAVTMALVAACNAIQRAGISPSAIDAVLVGTESPAYTVKSIAAITLGMLGIPENAFTMDASHACASATAAILSAVGLIQAGFVKRALVIATDICRYALESAGEPTQGAGAVGLIISDNPRIAKISTNVGRISGHVNDFFRPHGQETANVYGAYSVDAYLELQCRAYRDLVTQIGEFNPNFWIFHSPYAKLPIKFFRKLVLTRWIENPSLIANQLQGDITTPHEEWNSIFRGAGEIPREFIRVLKEKGYSEREIIRLNDALKQEYLNKLDPTLIVSQYFGNLYSASVWAQLLHLAENNAEDGDIVYFGSYGSGATALAGLLEFQPGFRDVVKVGSSICDFIRFGRDISFEDYEKRSNYSSFLPIIPQFCQIAVNSSEKGNFQGLALQFCDEGCVLPQNAQLAYCPRGHAGKHTRFFPLHAQLASTPHELDIDPLPHLPASQEVMVVGTAEMGCELQLNFRKVREEDDGLLQWIPVYETAISQHPLNLAVQPERVKKAKGTDSVF